MRLKCYIQILLVSLFVISCSSNEITKEDVGGIWFLKEIEGEEAAYIFGGGLPTANFDWDQQHIYGTGGCNRYTMSYELKGENIKPDSLVASEIYCESIETEQRFFRLLSESTKIKFENDTLTLTKGKDICLKFLRLDLSAIAEKK